jgi:Asp-tRNA(Asn)/Glu-tRNA(Gln) amidotransferase A subunit family amidase
VPYHILEQDGIDSATKKNFEDSIKKLESIGFEIRDIKLPNIGYSLQLKAREVELVKQQCRCLRQKINLRPI